MKKNLDSLTVQSLKEKLEMFVQNNPERAHVLDVPNEYLKLLVPERVQEVAASTDNISVIRKSNEREGQLSFIVFEKDFPETLTSQSAWDEWERRIEEKQLQKSLTRYRALPTAPDGVNRLHEKFRDEIELERLSISDRILATCTFVVNPKDENGIYMEEYDGEKGRGIATDFYKHSLPTFVRTLGFRYVTGTHTPANLPFFVDKLGRVQPQHIKREYRERLFPQQLPDAPLNRFASVQFLYDEDKERYLLK